MYDFRADELCLLLDWLRDQEQASDIRLNPPPLGFAPKRNSDVAAALTSGTKPEAMGGLLGLGQEFGYLSTGVSDETKTIIARILKFAKLIATQIELGAALDRIERFESRLNSYLTADEYRREVRTLREVIQDELKRRRFLYIPVDRAKLVDTMLADWQKTIVAFEKTAKFEIGFAIRCYVTGNPTACVFHLMRAAEMGMRALAKERRVVLKKHRDYAWADWQELLSGIDKQVTALNNKKRGPARDRALVFYQGILGEFEAFKDVYRNNVMHARETYDMPRALSVLNHVREFMERLSDKISEDMTKQIAWNMR